MRKKMQAGKDCRHIKGKRGPGENEDLEQQERRSKEE